jgi:hypothetical protein
LVEEDVTMTIVTQRRALLAPSRNEAAAPLPMSPEDRTPVWQRVVVVSMTLALTGTLGAVTWAELQRQPRPEAGPKPALIEFPIRPLETRDFVSDTLDSDTVEPDEAALLLEEVNRLLRLADALDVQIDRLAAQSPASSSDEEDGSSSALPEAEHLAAVDPDSLPVVRGAGAVEAPLAQVIAAAVAPVRSGPAAIIVRPAESIAPVDAAVAAWAGPPAILAFSPEAPPAETAGAAESASGIVAAEPVLPRPSPAPPPAPPRPRAAGAAHGPGRKPVAATVPVKLTAAQRHCQMIAVRFQIGVEPSDAEQRFLRKNCR